MRLSDSKNYIVTSDFAPYLLGAGSMYRARKSELLKIKDKKWLDTRLDVIALNLNLNATGYINYLALLTKICAADMNLEDNRFTELLDSGFIPIIFPPIIDKVDLPGFYYEAVKESKVKCLQKAAMTLKGRYIGVGEDIWVSRLEVANKYNLEPSEIRSSSLIQTIVIDYFKGK